MEDLSRLNTFKWDLVVEEMYEKERKILRKALELLLEMYRHREECTIQNVLKYRDRLYRQFMIKKEYGVKIPKKLKKSMLSELDKELFHLDDMIIPGYEPRPTPIFTIGGVEVPETIGQKRERRGRKKKDAVSSSALEDFLFLINYVETAQMAVEAESDRLMELERESMKRGRGRPEGSENKKGRKTKRKAPIVEIAEETNNINTSDAIILGQGDEGENNVQTALIVESIVETTTNGAVILGQNDEDNEVQVPLIRLGDPEPRDLIGEEGENEKRRGRKPGSKNIKATAATDSEVVIIDEEIVVRKFPTYFEQYLFQYTRKNRSIGSAQWCDHAYSELERIVNSMKSSVEEYISKWEEINTDEIYWFKKFLMFQTKFNLTPTLEGYDRDWVDDVENVEGGEALNRNGLNKNTIDIYRNFLGYVKNQSISIYINVLLGDEYAEETLYATANKREKVAPRKIFKRSKHIPTVPNVMYLPPVDGMKETEKNQIISIVNGIPIPSEYNEKPSKEITEDVIRSINNITDDVVAFPPKRLTKRVKFLTFGKARKAKGSIVKEESDDEGECNYTRLNANDVSSKPFVSYFGSKAPSVISSKPVKRYIPFADDPIYSYKPIITKSNIVNSSKSVHTPINDKKFNPIATFVHNGRTISFKDSVLESNMFKRPNNVIKKETPLVPIGSDVIMSKVLINNPKTSNVPILTKSAKPFIPKTIIDVEPIRLANPIKSVNLAKPVIKSFDTQKTFISEPICDSVSGELKSTSTIETISTSTQVVEPCMSAQKVSKVSNVSNINRFLNEFGSETTVRSIQTIKPFIPARTVNKVSNLDKFLNKFKTELIDESIPIVKSVTECELKNCLNDVVEISVPIRIPFIHDNTYENKNDVYEEYNNTKYYGFPADFHGFDDEIATPVPDNNSEIADLISFDEELCTEFSDSDSHDELADVVDIIYVKNDKPNNCDGVSSTDSDSESDKNKFNFLGDMTNSDSDTEINSNININIMDIPIPLDEISNSTPMSDVESDINYSETISDNFEEILESNIIENNTFADLISFDEIVTVDLHSVENTNSHTFADLISFDEILTNETNSEENVNLNMFEDLISFDEAIISNIITDNNNDLYEGSITNNEQDMDGLNLMDMGNEIRTNLMGREAGLFDVDNSPIDDLVKHYTRNFNLLHTFTL